MVYKKPTSQTSNTPKTQPMKPLKTMSLNDFAGKVKPMTKPMSKPAYPKKGK